MVIVGIAVANDVLVTRLEDGYGDRARARFTSSRCR
jgi:hypothetical protein